ncbi:chorismate-binding protein [Winogradskyella vincentii]|uniref:Chorismate-binding protein n=1 Tax=Winogradskyella vincentii TaxID=2877122 RepID=A0ABS7XYY9_9FLAO|nr:chorismate-binding protein [Winogradskyella vincentii]MCA0152868.1 chorismate-binding protein [Winogradskyella vincentii]
MQKDKELHTTDNYSESGFVFAPFDSTEKSILLPEKDCTQHILEVDSELKFNFVTNSNLETPLVVDKKSHIDLLKKGVSQIKDGKLDKVVLSRKEEHEVGDMSPLDLFKQLYSRYKNAMVYCWYHPMVGLWLGATPELLFKVEGRQLTTISLAGTQTINNLNQIKWTNKELEEQKIVTDYITNQIQDYTSNINVSETETVRAGDLLHLKTRIKSSINKDTRLNDIIRALHPTPAVCGFPKEASKAFITQNENYKRAYYTGFLGELNLKQIQNRNSNRRNVENNAYSSIKNISNFYVNLRCMQIKQGKALIYVGGGITKDSEPEKEWDETVNKTKTIVNVLK